MRGAQARAKARPAPAKRAAAKPKAVSKTTSAATPKRATAAAKPKAAAKPTASSKPTAASKPGPRPTPKPRPTRAQPAAPSGPPGPTRLDAYLVDGGRLDGVALHLHDLPAVHLPSGQLVVGDPFAARGQTLARALRPGAYPVTLVVGDFPDAARAVAAFVRLGHRPVARWEPAAADDGATDYAIDAAAAAFADARAFAAMVDERAGFPTASFAALERQLLTEHYVPAWGWASYQPSPIAAGTCVAFLAGGADRCPCWWGLDDAGAPTLVLTELASLP